MAANLVELHKKSEEIVRELTNTGVIQYDTELEEYFDANADDRDNYYSFTYEQWEPWMKVQLEIADELARLGALYLDEFYPDWRDNVDEERLNMSSSSSCILGQAFGDYGDGIRQIYHREIEVGNIKFPYNAEYYERNEFERIAKDRLGHEMGFLDNGACYQALDRAWQKQLNRR